MQGGYVAKKCPVVAQNQILIPAELTPPSPALQRRFDRGNDFEADVFAELKRLHGADIVLFPDDVPYAELIEPTMEAIARRVPLIAGGRLPDDTTGRRVGKPDLLVAAPAGYRAVDVKHHSALEPVFSPKPPTWPATCADLAAPAFETAVTTSRTAIRRGDGAKKDTLQLAHYQRMLDAAGLAATGAPIGGIIGVEGLVVWYDLDAPMWQTPAKSDGMKVKYRSTMERYDFEFDFRLDIMAVAQQVAAAGPAATAAAGALVVEPARCGECPECEWRAYCLQLLADNDDLTLLPGVNWAKRVIHHEHGITTRTALSALDVTTAALVSAKVKVAEAMAEAAEVAPKTPIEDIPVMKRRKKQCERLADAGLRLAQDLTALDERTAAYSDTPVGDLAQQIDLARAVGGSAPIYRARGIAEATIERADIEVDVDMENIEEGVYLWGTLLTDRTKPATGAVADPADPDRYEPFVTWAKEATRDDFNDAFTRYWTRLMRQRATAHDAGNTFAAYYYTDAETRYMREYAAATGILNQVEAFMDSDEWIDVAKRVSSQLITGGGMGLKVIAPIAGFHWDVEDPGGDVSMLWHDRATGVEQPSDETDQAAAREWLLKYNRNDVEATLAIRDWLTYDGAAIPAVEDLTPE